MGVWLRLAGVVNANRPPPIFPFAPLSAPLAPLPAGIWRCRSLSAYTMPKKKRASKGGKKKSAKKKPRKSQVAPAPPEFVADEDVWESHDVADFLSKKGLGWKFGLGKKEKGREKERRQEEKEKVDASCAQGARACVGPNGRSLSSSPALPSPASLFTVICRRCLVGCLYLWIASVGLPASLEPLFYEPCLNDVTPVLPPVQPRTPQYTTLMSK